MAKNQYFIFNYKFQLILEKIFIILTFLLISSCNKKEEISEKTNNASVATLTINDLNFNSEKDDNNIFIYLYLQSEYALTLKQFNSLFKNTLTKRGLDQRIEKGEIPKAMVEEFKKNFLIQIISEELFYQEGLKNPDIKIPTETIEKEISMESLKIIKSTNIPLEQYLDTIGLSPYEFSQSIKKELYRRKVMEDQLKFARPVSPEEIENLYQAKSKEGAFLEKFREVYLIEYLTSNSNITEEKVDAITELVTFQSYAKTESIHDSKFKEGRIEDVPRARKLAFKNNKQFISNLLFDQIWSADISKAVLTEVADRHFIIWVNKEFEKQSYLSPDLQMYLIRFLNIQNKIQNEQNLCMKIAKTAVFKIRYNNELIPLDLKKFYQKSIEILSQPIQQ
jgi:uncharacterized protein YozE (UPF0346 family)